MVKSSLNTASKLSLRGGFSRSNPQLDMLETASQKNACDEGVQDASDHKGF